MHERGHGHSSRFLALLDFDMRRLSAARHRLRVLALLTLASAWSSGCGSDTPNQPPSIAGSYTAVYPIDSPGGWHLIGMTGRHARGEGFDPAGVLMPGGIVRFVPERS